MSVINSIMGQGGGGTPSIYSQRRLCDATSCIANNDTINFHYLKMRPAFLSGYLDFNITLTYCKTLDDPTMLSGIPTFIWNGISNLIPKMTFGSVPQITINISAFGHSFGSITFPPDIVQTSAATINMQRDSAVANYNSFINSGIIKTDEAYKAPFLSGIYTYNTWLGVLSHTYDSAALFYYTNIIGGQTCDLANHVLWGNSTVFPRAYYDTLLNDAPVNEPPAVKGTNIDGSDRHFNAKYWGTPNIDNSFPNGYRLGNNTPMYGDKNGLDYMLMYNLYHIAYLNNVSYTENSCDCYKNPIDTSLHSIASGNTITYKKRVHPDYRYKNLSIPNYITHTVTVENGGIVYSYNDLVICKRNEVTDPTVFKMQGMMYQGDKDNNDSSKVGDIIINSGNTLEVGGTGASSILNVYRNSRIIVKSGATLRIKNKGKVRLQKQSQLIVEGNGLVILDSGMLLIDSSGFAEVKAQGKITIYSAGDLRLKDYGLAQIDSAGILELYTGNKVTLTGEHAVLNINGRLTIQGNTTFEPLTDGTASTTGYIVWGSRMFLSTPSVGARISLHNSGNSRKILEVYGTKYFTDSIDNHSQYLDSFNISDASVVMYGSISTGARFRSSHVVYTNPSGANCYIELHGQRNSVVDHCEFYSCFLKDNGRFAKELNTFSNVFYETNSGMVLNLGYIHSISDQFRSNGSGIYATYMKKVIVEKGIFDNCSEAIHIYDSTGLQLSKNKANYILLQNDFANNERVFVVDGSSSVPYPNLKGASMVLGCNTFKENDMITENTSNNNLACVNMSRDKTCSGYSGGNNVFIDNGLNNGGQLSPFYCQDIYMRKGNNMFIYTPTITISGFSHISGNFSFECKHDTHVCNLNTCMLYIDSNFFFPNKVYGSNLPAGYEYAKVQCGIISAFPNLVYSYFSNIGVVSDSGKMECQQSGNKIKYAINHNNGGLLNQSGKIKDINLLPNPSNGQFQIGFYIEGVSFTSGTIYIYDANGLPVYSQGVQLSEGYTYFNIDISNLPPGIYFLVYIGADGEVYTEIVIVL